MSNANEINEIALMSLEDKKGEVQVKKRVVCKKNPAVKDDEHLIDLTRLIFNKIATKGKDENIMVMVFKLPLPAINSIDGITCDAQIMIKSCCGNKVEFTLRMEAVMVHGRFENPHVYYHHDFYTQRDFNSLHLMLLTLLDDKIPDLRYYPMVCEFKEKDELEVIKLIDERLTKNKIGMYAETCGVCFERTRAKTGCNHTLCVPCADKIQLLAYEGANDWEENSGEPCCPLCRKDGGFHITF